MLSADEVRELLGLKPLLPEGGYFREAYRSAERLAGDALPERYVGARSLSTAIYFLLTPDTFSALHRLRSTEIYHFYMGDPVQLLTLWPDGSVRTFTLGTDLLRGMRPLVTVPRDVWQGSRLTSGGSFALLGTTMCPGFELADYEQGDRATLLAAYPRARDGILALTR